MVTLPAARRLAVLELAVRHGFAVIEDDYDNEFHYTGRPVLPLAALDRAGSVLYVGTLSKVLAPGLRLGFLAGSPRVLEAVARLRRIVDRQGDAATEVAVADLVEDGTVPRHLRRMRRIYAARQAVMASALRERLGEVVDFEVPSGGLSLWIRSRRDVRAWAERALELGLGLEVGSRFHLAGAPLQNFRAGFASLGAAELGAAVDVLYRALPATGYAPGAADHEAPGGSIPGGGT
jgi:GntR family transcriptional regulator/MocR family aminotransferase